MSFRWRAGVLAMAVLCMQPMWAHAQTKADDYVGGTVVGDEDGHALAHAQVILTNTKTEEVEATTATDEEGHFRFEPVPPGKYRLSGTAAHYLPTSYMQHQEYSTALVTGAGLATEALVLRLVPAGSIAGRIVDESGEPVVNASVMLYREDLTAAQKVSHELQTLPNDLGEYEFTGLKPGRYFLSVTGVPWYATYAQAADGTAKVPYRAVSDPALDVAYPMVFYPDAPDSDHASALELHAGDHLAADMHLIAEHAVTLTLHVTKQREQAASPRNYLLMRTVFGVEEPLNPQMSFGDGVLTLSGIAPGRYDLEETMGRGGVAMQVVPLDMTTTGATMDMSKQPETSTVTATVHMVGGGQVPASLPMILHSVQWDRNVMGMMSDKGIVTFADVPAGDYFFEAAGNEKEMSVTGVSVEGKQLADGRLRVARSVSVELNLAATQVDVEGFVKRGEGAGAAAMVVLVPVGPDKRAELFRRDQSDLDGSFLLRNVVPGDYIAVAIDDGWALHWTDMETMMPYLPHGVPVTVTVSSPAAMHLTQAVATQPR